MDNNEIYIENAVREPFQPYPPADDRDLPTDQLKTGIDYKVDIIIYASENQKCGTRSQGIHKLTKVLLERMELDLVKDLFR